MPLTKRPESAVEYCLARSTASLIVTAAGTSRQTNARTPGRSRRLAEGGGIGEGSIVRMAGEDLAGRLARHLVLVQRLQGDLAGAPPLGHCYRGAGWITSGRVGSRADARHVGAGAGVDPDG